MPFYLKEEEKTNVFEKEQVVQIVVMLNHVFDCLKDL